MSWYDTQLQTTCSFGTASDGQTRCLPTAIESPGLLGYQAYSDMGCTVKATMIIPGCTPQLNYISTTESLSDGGCSFGKVYNAAGRQFTGEAYAGTPGSCTQTGCSGNAPDGGCFWVEFGSAIDPSTFAHATLTTEVK